VRWARAVCRLALPGTADGQWADPHGDVRDEPEAAEWLVVVRGRVVEARAARRLTVRELFADAVDERLIGRSPIPPSKRRQPLHPTGIFANRTGAYTESEAAVTKKLIDIDEDVLAQATDILGAATMKEAVNRALTEVVLLAERRAHADRLASMDGLDLDDDQTMAGAWR
jgi:Arc/MetJ family transcription regulator